MKKYVYPILFIVLILILVFCKEAPTDAPTIITEITGKIYDKQSGIALSGVQVTTLPVTSSVITSSDGSYKISDIAPGNYKVTAQKDGYNTNFVNATVT
ncbi:MAG: carboxypeptidase-like regulatory domain-containing protein, partial [Melioribacteraceae bacterium]